MFRNFDLKLTLCYTKSPEEKFAKIKFMSSSAVISQGVNIMKILTNQFNKIAFFIRVLNELKVNYG